MTSNEDLAKEAVAEANAVREQNGQGPVSRTAFERAKQRLVPGAYDYLEEDVGYDPKDYAPKLAEAVVIEYVKTKLIGRNPEASQNFIRAKMRWRDEAGKRYHVNSLEDGGADRLDRRFRSQIT